jgi:hypothetical protein
MKSQESALTVKGKKQTGGTSVLETLKMGMDWGTVLVYSCEKDCEDGTRQFTSTEYAAVQLELT